jgi:hypothetical protein
MAPIRIKKIEFCCPEYEIHRPVELKYFSRISGQILSEVTV